MALVSMQSKECESNRGRDRWDVVEGAEGSSYRNVKSVGLVNEESILEMEAAYSRSGYPVDDYTERRISYKKV